MISTARVVSQEKGFYLVEHHDVRKLAEVSGKLRFEAAGPEDYPAVGDWVQVDLNEAGGNAVIHAVLPRSSSFVRKAAGTALQGQVVAANVDTVFLCMALDANFNLRRLERYLAIAWESGSRPVVVLTKSDLCDELDARLADVAGVAFGVDVLAVSSLACEGIGQLAPYLADGQTVAFMGSSGVGKSTLINRLLGRDQIATGEVRADGKGRHTTTHRELVHLESGACVIDTPGMRELGMWDASTGVEQTFRDIETLAASCRFADCSHTNEPGCAVRAALESGELSEDRWKSYMKLAAETAYVQDGAAYLAAKELKFRQIAKQNKAAGRR